MYTCNLNSYGFMGLLSKPFISITEVYVHGISVLKIKKSRVIFFLEHIYIYIYIYIYYILKEKKYKYHYVNGSNKRVKLDENFQNTFFDIIQSIQHRRMCFCWKHSNIVLRS